MKTLIFFISCCMEESRFNIMQQVVESLKSEQEIKNIDIEKQMIVFDNGSTNPGTINLLQKFNSPIYQAKKNNGYWSALDWLLTNGDWNDQGYEYLYIIESDHLHYALEKLQICENALDSYERLGSIRCNEYSIEKSHLYNKTLQNPNGRKYAWVSHVNAVTGKPVKLRKLIEPIYESNFLTCLHSLNRLSTIKEVFSQLRKMNKFSEVDFQRLYHNHYPLIGQLNGGLFHARLGFTLENADSLSGSWSSLSNLNKIGYKQTRNDQIIHYKANSVTRIK